MTNYQSWEKKFTKISLPAIYCYQRLFYYFHDENQRWLNCIIKFHMFFVLAPVKYSIDIWVKYLGNCLLHWSVFVVRVPPRASCSWLIPFNIRKKSSFKLCHHSFFTIVVIQDAINSPKIIYRLGIKFYCQICIYVYFFRSIHILRNGKSRNYIFVHLDTTHRYLCI